MKRSQQQLQKNITSDWQQAKLGDISIVIMGQSPASGAYNECGNGLPLIQGNNDIKGKKTIKRIWTSEITKKANLGDIILTVRAPVGVVGVATGDVCIGRGVCTFKPTNLIKNNYLFRFFEYFEPRWKTLEQGSTFTAVNSIDIKKLKLSLPPLPEQNRIVAVLEAWDKAIEKLTQKIEIKKNIKKGLMQDLLTGKKRLGGFKDKWIFTMLGDICGPVKTGKLDANAMVKGGKYRFYTCAKDYYLIDNYAFDTEALLVSGNGANVGYIHYFKGKFNAYQRTYVLDKFKTNLFFTKYLLDTFLHRRISDEKCEGNTPYIKMDTITEMNIKIPKSTEEQSAIANILTIVDKEVDTLENKLSIIKDQKKYLLNNLITGAIRTPENLISL